MADCSRTDDHSNTSFGHFNTLLHHLILSEYFDSLFASI
jgi:hypothetical protein